MEASRAPAHTTGESDDTRKGRRAVEPTGPTAGVVEERRHGSARACPARDPGERVVELSIYYIIYMCVLTNVITQNTQSRLDMAPGRERADACTGRGKAEVCSGMWKSEDGQSGLIGRDRGPLARRLLIARKRMSDDARRHLVGHPPWGPMMVAMWGGQSQRGGCMSCTDVWL